jgi:hypothetical protein
MMTMDIEGKKMVMLMPVMILHLVQNLHTEFLRPLE